MKAILRGLALLASTLSLAACGGDDTGGAAPALDSGTASDAGDGAAEAAPDAPADGTSDDAPIGRGPHAQQVEDLARPLVDDAWTVAMVVGLVSEEGVEYYGFGPTAGGVPDPDSVFEIGSISKTFTSLVLAELVEDGVVNLDQPVQDLLPAQVQMPERNGKVITLRHLSTHHAGLPRMPDNFVPASESDPYVDYDADDLYDFLNGYALPRDPGASFEYSNLGAGLLGHALALETSLDYESLVRARVSEPLQLSDTSIQLDGAQQERLMQGHDADGQPVPPWSFGVLAPAGALRSTARDMIAYVSAQAGLSSTSLDTAMAATHEPQYPVDTDLEIGLGWLIEEGRYVWHNGGTGGFGTFVGFDKQTRTGVTVLSNVQGIYVPETGLGRALLRVMAGESYDPVELPPTLHLATEDLEPYAGQFQVTVEGQTFTMSFAVEGENLYATIPGLPPVTLKLYAMAEARFYMRRAPVWVTFEGGGGVYDAFTLEQQGGPPFTGTRVP